MMRGGGGTTSQKLLEGNQPTLAVMRNPEFVSCAVTAGRIQLLILHQKNRRRLTLCVWVWLSRLTLCVWVAQQANPQCLGGSAG